VGGGTLIAKNRDWSPAYPQILKLISPPKGFKYYGIFEDGNEVSGIKMGVNEKGLVVLSARMILAPEKREGMKRVSGVNRKLLIGCGSVEEALKRQDLFVGARSLLLADKEKIVLIEIGTNGQAVIRKTHHGIFFQTNHFVSPQLIQFNPETFTPKRLIRFKKTQERLKQIERLLQNQTKHSMEDFIRISFSREGAPYGMIWRDAGPETRVRTLSTFIVYQPEKGPSEFFVRIADHDKPVREFRMLLNEIYDNK
jgi:hypothetical protein